MWGAWCRYLQEEMSPCCLDSLCNEGQLAGCDSARLAVCIQIPPRVTLNEANDDEVVAPMAAAGLQDASGSRLCPRLYITQGESKA